MKTKEASNEIQNLVNKINELPIKQRKNAISNLEKELQKIILPYGDIIDGFIYRTINLDQFNTVKGNRLIKENTAYTRQLAESISKFGNITPIIINESNEVIDGQRRLSAIRNNDFLEKEVRYTCVEGTDINSVGDLNRLQVKWNYKDWLNKFIIMDKEEYIKYQKFENMYSKIMRPRSLRSLLMNNRVGSFSTKVWESGEFIIDKENLNNNIRFLDFLGMVSEMGGSNNIFAKNRDFQNALHQIYKNIDKLDEERLLQKIRLGFVKLNIKTELSEYKNILAELYDDKLPKKQVHIEDLLKEDETNENHLVNN